MRFAPGKQVDEDTLAFTFSDRTEYDAGEVKFLTAKDLPDALR